MSTNEQFKGRNNFLFNFIYQVALSTEFDKKVLKKERCLLDE